MPTFKYLTKDQNAHSVRGKMQADSQSVVVEELHKRKYTIISIVQVKDTPSVKFLLRGKRVKGEDVVIFSRQLATMIEAGIPIMQSLEALQEQMNDPTFQAVIGAVKEDIQLGSSLSAAFAKHPGVFDKLFVNMVKVGEMGGVLSSILDRISGYMEKSLKLKHKVQSAMIYPSVVLIMAVVITMVLLVKVVPTFASIYSSFDRKLPAMTRLLINVSNVLKTQLVYCIVGVVILGVVLNRVYRTEKGAFLLDKAKLKMPIFGNLIRKIAISRFARTLATLLQSDVPILESLDIVGKTCGNKVLETVIESVKNNVREGESIAVPLVKSGVFPPMVTRMISVGEKSGQLEKMLTKVAEFYEDQVDAAVAGLTSIIEPLIIGFLGIVVGFIVIALFLPIINITTILK